MSQQGPKAPSVLYQAEHEGAGCSQEPQGKPLARARLEAPWKELGWPRGAGCGSQPGKALGRPAPARPGFGHFAHGGYGGVAAKL